VQPTKKHIKTKHIPRKNKKPLRPKRKMPPKHKPLRKTTHRIPRRTRSNLVLRRQLHQPKRPTKKHRTTRSKHTPRSQNKMTCAQCGKVNKADGNWECAERHWLFAPELATQQRLCDDKPNHTPQHPGEHTFGPQ